MSVLSCARRGCDEVMCQTYVPDVGYICRDCQKEFKGYVGSRKDVFPDSPMSIEVALKSFMETYKGDFHIREIDVESFFRSYDRD